MASLVSRNGAGDGLNQLAIFKCELPHVSRSLDAETERRTPFCLGESVAQWSNQLSGASIMTMRIACAPAGGAPVYRRLTTHLTRMYATAKPSTSTAVPRCFHCGGLWPQNTYPT